jgi:tellurite resistance protein TerC
MAAISPTAVLAAESSRDNFVDLDVGTQWWIALAVVIVALLAVDLYRHRDNNEPTARGAALESAGWVACGLAFGVVVLVGFGGDAFGEYISGYLIEKSLSVDNVFVWSILFSSMAVPLRYQHRVLFWGIFGALTLRLVFILIGSALIERFSIVLVGFGVFLVFTGLRVIRHRDDEGENSSVVGLGLLGRVIPVSDEYDGHKFLTMRDGVRMATPLLAALVVVEATDVVFAVDSVPAVLAVSNEPYLVFASNAFAILGLRAMYFLLADARQRFHYLSHGLGGILVFVGIKMAASEWYHLDTYISLGGILLILAAAIIFSERRTRLEVAN